jgi:hypothetical protein
MDGSPRLVIAEVRVFPDIWGAGARPLGTWTGDVADDVAAPRVPAGGVTTTLLRSVRLAASRRTTRELLKSHALPDGVAVGTETSARRTKGTPGRKPVPADVLAEVAAAYVDALRRKAPVIPAVRKALGGNVSSVTVRNRVAQARARGLLTRSVPGQRKSGAVGGVLTDAARALLSRRRRRRTTQTRRRK